MNKLLTNTVPIFNIFTYECDRKKPPEDTALTSGLMFTVSGATPFDIIIKCVSENSAHKGKSFSIQPHILKHIFTEIDTSSLVVVDDQKE